MHTRSRISGNFGVIIPQPALMRKRKNAARPGYREAIMTDGILVEDIIHEINRLAETGTSDLGTVIFNCENAM